MEKSAEGVNKTVGYKPVVYHNENHFAPTTEERKKRDPKPEKVSSLSEGTIENGKKFKLKQGQF